MNSDIRFYWTLFLRRLPLMSVVFVLCSAFGIGLSVTLPSRYAATARLLVESPQIPNELAASTVSATATERLQIIEQRLLTRANLIDIANEFGVFRGSGRMAPDEVVSAMRDLTTIRRSGGGGATFVTISFHATTPQLSADVANKFVTIVLSEDSERRQGLAEQTLEYFEQDVARLDQELAIKSQAIVDFKAANQDALPENLEFRVGRLSRLQDQVASASRDRSLLTEQRTRLAIIGSSARAEQLSPARRELRDAQQELNRALTIYSETNPRVRALQARIDQLDAAVAAESPDALSQATSEDPAQLLFELDLADIERRLNFLDERTTRAELEIQELEDAISRTPGNAILLEALERDYRNTLSQYNQAAGNLARAQTGERIEVLSKGERISVIEQATPPTSPTSPNRPMIAGGGVALGAALAVGIFLLLELTNRAIRRPLDLVRGLSIQPLATIPYLETSGGKARRRALQTILIGGLAIGIPVALWAVHTFYLPLDLVVDRLLARFGL